MASFLLYYRAQPAFACLSALRVAEAKLRLGEGACSSVGRAID